MSTKFSIGHLNQLADAFEKAGLDEKDLTKMRSQEAMTAIKGILRGLAISFITHTFTVMVDDTNSVEEAAEACGLDRRNSDINSTKFPCPANGTVSERKLAIFHFQFGKTSISFEDVLTGMGKEGWRPATIFELISIAMVHPDLQREFLIAALGSVTGTGDNREVACLSEGGCGRSLFSVPVCPEMGSYYRFLAVRLPVPQSEATRPCASEL